MLKLILVVLEIVVDFGSIIVHTLKNTDLGLVTLIVGELKLSFSPPVLMCLLPYFYLFISIFHSM